MRVTVLREVWVVRCFNRADGWGVSYLGPNDRDVPSLAHARRFADKRAADDNLNCPHCRSVTEAKARDMDRHLKPVKARS